MTQFCELDRIEPSGQRLLALKSLQQTVYVIHRYNMQCIRFIVDNSLLMAFHTNCSTSGYCVLQSDHASPVGAVAYLSFAGLK